MILIDMCHVQIKLSTLNIAYEVAPKPNSVEGRYIYTFDAL